MFVTQEIPKFAVNLRRFRAMLEDSAFEKLRSLGLCMFYGWNIYVNTFYVSTAMDDACVLRAIFGAFTSRS